MAPPTDVLGTILVLLWALFVLGVGVGVMVLLYGVSRLLLRDADWRAIARDIRARRGTQEFR